MKKTLHSVILISNFLIISFFGFAQDPTIGLKFYNELVSDGYLLFTPEKNNNVYLVDPCGQKIHQWIFTENPGATCYLLEDGNLLRAGKENIEVRDWNNNIVWSFEIGTLGYNQHHDIEPLPNGNVLCLVNDTYTSAEMLAIGKDPTTVGATLKLDKVIELQPLGLYGASVVWEWKFFDHFIQNYDNTKPNYGVIADHPELIDLNYVDTDVPNQLTDYTHVNGIDYNATLDQIILSTRHFNEVHIIDHSTTTTEASGHIGGTSNSGGDILWRWGNPRVYGQGGASDQKLFLQHDAKWVETGYLDEGKISVFNNGISGRTNSSIHLISTEIIDGIYTKENDFFKPLDYDWSWSGSILGDVMSEGKKSGTHALPNGNMILCETSKGQASEISKSGDVLWVYKNPTGIDGNVSAQFETISSNGLFRAEKYPIEYAGFVGKDLTPLGIIENINQVSMNCVNACQATATFGAMGWGAVMPSIDNLVLIEADYDTALLGSFEACKLIVNPGATLRVNAGDYILVNTDITVSVTGSLLVEHTGSVVQVEDSAMVTNDGTINVNVTTPEVAPRDFILSGSPMTMEMRNGVYNNSFRVVKHLTAAFDPDPAVDAFYMPNVVANFVDVDFNDWVFHTGIINPGEGYFVYPQTSLADGNSTYDLVYEQGTLNNGVITYAMEFNGDANSSPSMLANPYPSAIDAFLFLNANPEIDEVYFWEHITEPGAFPGGNGTTENYSMEDISMYNLSGGIGAGTPATNGSTTPNGMIATSQGFGVKASAMGAAIFNNAMRVTTGNNTLRNTVSEGNRIWLQLENAQYSLSSEVLIAFMPMATESYDSGYDSHQIGSLVSLYSHLPDNTMSLGIQGREAFNKEIQIPMGYASQIDETTTFKITIKQLEGVDIENATVYLIDKATRTITNLTKEGAYKFRSRKGNFPNRFTLQFMAYDRFGRILGDDAAAIAAISVVPNPTDGLLFINSPNSIINTITLTDMRGRLVRNLKNIDGLNSTIDISVLDSAVYFLKIETEKGTLVRKVMKE